MRYIANVLGFVGALVLAAVLGVLVAAVPFLATLPPCATEDSVNCYWNATSQGNGEGESFIALYIAGNDVIIYK